VNPAEIVKRAALEQNPSNLRFIQERPLNFGYRKYPTKSNSEMRDMALKAMKPKLEIPTQKTAATGKLPC